MIMEKTAMQQYIEWLSDPCISDNQDKDKSIKKGYEFIETERQQIIEAYENPSSQTFTGEQYYNLKYKK